MDIVISTANVAKQLAGMTYNGITLDVTERGVLEVQVPKAQVRRVVAWNRERRGWEPSGELHIDLWDAQNRGQLALIAEDLIRMVAQMPDDETTAGAIANIEDALASLKRKSSPAESSLGEAASTG